MVSKFVMPQSALPVSKLPLFLRAVQMLAEAHHRADASAKACHERFNIFTTLLKEDDEVRLHTRFLHALLDPNGLHDCGDLFLKLFFETLSKNPGLDHDDKPCVWQAPGSDMTWTVEKEAGRSSGYGQMDILLNHTNFAIAIENKIHAKEGKLQLSSYGQFLQRCGRKATCLIYLTKDGKQSSSHDGHPYMRISYSNHILLWLEACLRETYRMVPVNQILLQYREVVRQITNKTLENPLMKPVIDYVTHNPDILRYLKELNDAADEATAVFMDRLASAVLDNLNRDFKATLRDDMVGGRFGLDDEGDIFITPQFNSSLDGVPFQICLERDTASEALLVGIYADQKVHGLTDVDLAQLKRMDEWLTEHSKASGFHKEDANGIWPVGWHDILPGLDDGGVADLMTRDFDGLVAEVCGQVREYMKLLEAATDHAKTQLE
jgi:hypothetical protein